MTTIAEGTLELAKSGTTANEIQRLTFTGNMAGSRLPTSRIWIGHNNRHPLQNPFIVTRVS